MIHEKRGKGSLLATSPPPFFSPTSVANNDGGYIQYIGGRGVLGQGGDHVRSSRGGSGFYRLRGGNTNFCSEGGQGGGIF